MKREDAEKWVEALESNKYSKTQGQLGDNEGFCCLGVLCDVFSEKIESETSNRIYLTDEMEMQISGKDRHDRYFVEEFELTRDIAEMFDIEKKDEKALAELNDQTETFEEVIVKIKELYLGDTNEAK